MRSRRLVISFFLSYALPALAQVLDVSPVSGLPRGSIALNVSMASSIEGVPTVLKWELTFPAQLLESSEFEIAGAAKDSGKSLTCSLRQPYTYVCVLAGGQAPIENGRIATFRFKVRPDARAGTAAVRIDHVEGATVDLRPLKFLGSESRIEIR